MTWMQVVLDDLSSMSQHFEKGATDYSAAAAAVKASPVDSGDGSLNAAMQTATDLIEVLNKQVQAEIEKQGRLVKQAHDTYASQEDDNDKLLTFLTKSQ